MTATKNVLGFLFLVLLFACIILGFVGCAVSPISPPNDAMVTILVKQSGGQETIEGATVWNASRAVGNTDTFGELAIYPPAGQEVCLLATKDGYQPSLRVCGIPSPGKEEVWTFWLER